MQPRNEAPWASNGGLNTTRLLMLNQ